MRFKYWLILLLKIFISIVLIALLVLPYADALQATGVEDYSEWDYLFIWEDELLILMFAPLFILWPWYLIHRKNWQIKGLLLLSLYYFFNGIGNIVLPIQDFAPGIGLLASVTLFPPIFCLYWLTRKRKTDAPQ